MSKAILYNLSHRLVPVELRNGKTIRRIVYLDQTRKISNVWHSGIGTYVRYNNRNLKVIYNVNGQHGPSAYESRN